MNQLKLDASDFGVQAKEEATAERIKQSYLHYKKDGAALKRLFTFFNVEIETSAAGRIKTEPLKNKMDRWLEGFESAGLNAVSTIEAIKGTTAKKTAKK